MTKGAWCHENWKKYFKKTVSSGHRTLRGTETASDLTVRRSLTPGELVVSQGLWGTGNSFHKIKENVLMQQNHRKQITHYWLAWKTHCK